MDKDRGKDRHGYEGPDFVYVRFKIDKESEENRERVLSVQKSSTCLDRARCFTRKKMG